VQFHVSSPTDLRVEHLGKNPVKASRKKYFCLSEGGIKRMVASVPPGKRGVSRTSRHARRDAMDASVLIDERH
jgi:hypothetical protein